MYGAKLAVVPFVNAPYLMVRLVEPLLEMEVLVLGISSLEDP